MHGYVDDTGYKWRVDINIQAVKEVRDALDIDMLDPGQDMLAKLFDDPLALCDILYVLCQAQAETAGITDEDFGRRLRGDAIDAASTAFIEELADFFPNHRRQILQAMTAKIQQLETTNTDKTLELLAGEELDRIVETHLNRVRDRISGLASTASPARSASTPGH